MTDTLTSEHLTIDIYSDVMCPWCLIGYGQLTKALGELEGEIAATPSGFFSHWRKKAQRARRASTGESRMNGWIARGMPQHATTGHLLALPHP